MQQFAVTNVKVALALQGIVVFGGLIIIFAQVVQTQEMYIN
jgi:hypothetical protein